MVHLQCFYAIGDSARLLILARPAQAEPAWVQVKIALLHKDCTISALLVHDDSLLCR